MWNTWFGCHRRMMLILFVVFIFGCSLPSRYSVTLRNDTNARLTDVQVAWGDYDFRAGIVSDGTGKTEAFPDAPFPESAVVYWRSPDGILHKVQVDVDAVVGRQNRWKNVELVFSISDSGDVGVSLKPGLA